MKNNMKIAISCGDVNGIGIEILFKALHRFFTESGYYDEIDFTLAINKKTLLNYSKLIRNKIKIYDDHFLFKGRKINLIECETEVDIHFGQVAKSAGKLAAESIYRLTDKTIKGEFDALLTLPISKEAIYLTGWTFPGHTEYISNKCNIDNPLMLLCTKALRIALTTIHIPLKDVPKNISKEKIIDISKKLYKSLKLDFNERSPKIAVLSLNPHAGENGNLGNEENKIIIPAVDALNSMEIETYGPFSADGFFAHGEYLRYDAILAMYHDQGLIPIKLLSMGGGINFTAGLPIIRVSPDHGTAFDIAGKNLASETSTYNSIELAYIINKNRMKRK